MHSHDDATYHLLTVVTGQLRLTIEGQSPMDLTPGQVIDLKGGAKHTFTNTSAVAATIVEVFGKAPAGAAEVVVTPLLHATVQLESGGKVILVDPLSHGLPHCPQ